MNILKKKKKKGTFLGAQGSMNKETDIQNTVSLFVIIISVNKKDKGTSDSRSSNKHKQEFVFMAKCLGIE